MKVKELGQVWTPKNIVDKMINLITVKSPNLILEPSSGTGMFYNELIKKFNNVIGVEIDPSIAHKNAIIASYFDTNYQPDVIIGNPPYVDFKNIQNLPKSNFLIHKPNLYLFFIEKALNDLKQNGELIFIVPSAVFTSTSSYKLNEKIYKEYSITYFELIDENVWQNASVPTAIIKIIKTKNHIDKINYFYSNGKILFGDKPKQMDGIMMVKVGGASGFNSSLKKGDVPFVVSHTERTKQLNYIEYQPKDWIRAVPKPPKDFTYQIFVNCKTRNKNPFYILENEPANFINYDASVLCLFVNLDLNETKMLVKKLNNINWEMLGIKRSGRFHFSQSILSAIVSK
ncbi:N-6 DNA methylase [Mycoplasma sp. NEAQ87857]|uniref:Eco57I restriction-modification methylase domain-containing protein n=1 Tax=Mycoplasma sp. NEAQ87857 TaxID=2683967 RepID=UPI0013186D5F|nr:N-6 DNA methylase [Mycoplasma sp. NEAQ87857]QGZ97356.1 N-6 DNA methylase [Mycoplasma sp. NEAQ87857]